MNESDAREAAAAYMRDKGYEDIQPIRVERLGMIECWYFLYQVQRGRQMELEVSHSDGEWEWTVMWVEK